ncbi:putative bifunctional diguanylate cyclase/phosphodiesterase [Thiorhodococcus minor]|uniref:Bifunctional diguanylate cyclase/phosphodiesterase n=1 Tax=Thiorhodococcus minor TaxID=57489 RepID=A0A6M0K2Z4_9GAMM|nr:bifunctional diguanylate cyclase/phosphodiesterase [Thiorhodococcus minor]NEV62967.1 bifunctional diguanylate cyclase/phosphodiesterase [Thiorhodococcus minor]
MNLALHPRLLSPAETTGELSKGGAATLFPLALDVLREAMAQLPACRTLTELFSVLNACSRTLVPTAKTATLLRQPDACFELVQCSPRALEAELREQADAMIESGHFAQALKQGLCYHRERPDRASLLLRIATPRRIYGVALWTSHHIPEDARQALGALTDLAAMSLERFQGGAESFLVQTHTDRPSVGGISIAEDVAIPADQLTGLAHRTHFIRFLQRALEQRTPSTSVGTLLLDIDGFHRVNRELGCDMGDQILRDVALRLDSALRSRLFFETLGIAECDLCFSRTGADEFGLAIARLRTPQHLDEIAAHLHSHVAEGFLQGGSRLHLSLSIGLADSGQDADASSPQALLRNADTALKKAKLSGRNKHAIYTPDWDESGSPHLRTESLLQEALRQDRFSLHYQPLFGLTDMRLVGAEVLLRLDMTDGSPIPPSKFIPVAESTGQIAEIGEWVTRQVCHQIRAWDALGYARIPFSINVSGIELSLPRLTERFARILAAEQVPHRRIHVEITETAIARNEKQALANIRELREAGFEVWIDDFGTGYSSLKSLKNFPISGIKLDREFVKDLVGDLAAEGIAISILEMAQRLRYPVIAEGIETAAQLAFLRAEGCASGQGFHLGRPVPTDDFQKSYFAQTEADSGQSA